MTAQNILFNDGWQFCLCDIGTELSALPGRHWYDVELPHDWLINDTSKLYETGEGWYRRSLPCSAEQLSGRVLLNFDGVYMNSTLFVNGKEAGSWTYGYSAFEHDITDFLHEGENELLLRVSHQSPNTRWYSGAGIFRDVMLKLRPAAYIGTNGVYIHSAPQPEGGWTTEVETDVVGEASDIRMLLEVFDPAGASMGGYGLEAHFDGGHEKFTASFNSTDPELWSVDDPMLYTLKISLYSGSELLDCVNETFGYRTAEFDPDRGFLLNGEHVKLHGVCIHHDLGALGSALNEAALARQLRIMKEMGVNAIRTSHNMPARRLVQLCDEMGLLVDSEAFDMWEKPKTEFDNHRFFTEHAERDVRSWIERDRNHPCIIMWSIGNEINDTIDPHGLDITKRLYEYVLKYDPKGNAAPTIGSNYMGDENAQKCSDVVKLAGYNYSEYLYDEHHAKYPGWVIYGSETASAVRSRGIYRFPAELPLLTGEDCQCSSLDNSVVGWGRYEIMAARPRLPILLRTVHLDRLRLHRRAYTLQHQEQLLRHCRHGGIPQGYLLLLPERVAKPGAEKGTAHSSVLLGLYPRAGDRRADILQRPRCGAVPQRKVHRQPRYGAGNQPGYARSFQGAVRAGSPPRSRAFRGRFGMLRGAAYSVRPGCGRADLR